jgi:hypothetical protein
MIWKCELVKDRRLKSPEIYGTLEKAAAQAFRSTPGTKEKIRYCIDTRIHGQDQQCYALHPHETSDKDRETWGCAWVAPGAMNQFDGRKNRGLDGGIE